MSQQGGHAAAAHRTEDEGRVSRLRGSTRKQYPGQSLGLSRYTQLIPASHKEGMSWRFSSSRESVQRDGKGWDVPRLPRQTIVSLHGD